VTFETQSPHIGEVALAAAFGNGEDMVCVPQRLSAAFAQAPFFVETAAGGVVKLAQVAAESQCIGAAGSADTVIPVEDFLA
jgi:hypothetical protein